MVLPDAGFPRTAALSPRVQIVAQTGSTNADMLELAADDPDGWPHLSLLATDDQRAGRGRLDRTWVAPPGTALAASLVLRLGALPVARTSWIPLLAGAAMAAAVDAQLGRQHEVALKWPNDVLVDRGKIAGLLVQAGPGFVVVGAGVNTRMTPSDLPIATATSFAALGAEADLDALLADWLAGLRDPLAAFAVAEGDADRSGVRALVAERMTMLGQDVEVALPDGSLLAGRADRLDAEGRLVVATDAGETAVAAGDVTRVRPAPAA